MSDPHESPTSGYSVDVGGGRPELDQRLSDELDRVNATATPGVAPARELTVRVLDADGELAAGLSGWTWGVAAGIGMTWVREASRGDGLGSRLLAEFESEAGSRGARHVFVTSFTFQAPGFYERHGYREIFRWDGVPTEGTADVHLREDLQASGGCRRPGQSSGISRRSPTGPAASGYASVPARTHHCMTS